MTRPAPPNEVGNSTQKGKSKATGELHASPEKPCPEDHNLQPTGETQPQDVKSLDDRESLLVKDKTNLSRSHEPQDDGNTNLLAGAAGPSIRSSLPRSQPPAPSKTQINEQFLQAASKGNWEAMNSAIKSGADLGAKTSFPYETALHLACRLGYHTVLQNLLKQKDILNNLKSHMEAQDIYGWTPLHSACSHNETGFKRVYEFAVEHRGRDISTSSQDQSHPTAEGTKKTLDILFDIQGKSTKKFDVNASDIMDQTALHLACRYSSEEVVKSLVNNGASVNVTDNFKNTPLIKACQYQSTNVIDFLLEKGAKVNTSNGHQSSPLTIACEYQKEGFIKRLLDAGADYNWTDNDGDSPLILASRFGNTAMVREILEHKPNLDKKNDKGESALRCAFSNKKARDEMLPLLLNSGCTLDQQDASILFPRGSTESFSADDIQRSIWSKTIRGMFLKKNQPADTDLSVTIKPLLEYASKEEKVFATIEAGTGEYFEILFEATKDLGLPKNICQIIRSSKAHSGSGQYGENNPIMIFLQSLDEITNETYELLRVVGLSSTLLQLSAFFGDYMLVWYLLKTSQIEKEDDIERAMEIATKRLHGETTPEKPKTKPRDATEPKNPRSEEDSKRYELTINMLQNAAAIMSMSGQLPKELPTRPNTKDMLDKKPQLERHHATVVDFYRLGQGEDDPIDLLRASPSVFDLVYASDESSVEAIMRTAEKTFDHMVKATKSHKTNELQLRWIHLPANHMGWMEHLAERVYFEKHEREKWSSFYDLAQQSRIELPTDGSKIKFMKPICIKEEQPQKLAQKQAGDAIATRMALYAPYVTFGYCDISQRENTKYKRLEGMYKGEILHGPRSLDRFYYNALPQEKMDERDRSQVVTRGLLTEASAPGGILPRTIAKWPYLTVDQLWIWVVDKDTIITSSTHREDGFNDLLVDRIFDQLRQGSSMRSGQKIPTSAIEMSQFLISSCADFVGKLTWQDVCRDDDIRIRQDAKNKSVLLLFADKLNEAMAREKDLFQKFRKRVEVEKKNSRNRGPRHKLLQPDTANLDPTDGDIGNTEVGLEESQNDNLKDWDAVYSAAELLDEVKDIRDELMIIRFLVTQQQHVWSGLIGTDPDSHDPRSPRFTGEELDDMIKMTDTIQKSVNELINLEENSIGIKESEQLVSLAERADQQSEENARQERILMLFTFVTIVFTPLSFMASYYALNTSTSRHNNEGELEYEPRWMNQRIFGTSAGIVGSLLFYASFGAMLRIPARIRWLVKNKPQIWKLMKTEGLIYAIKAASKVREYFRSGSVEDFVLKIEEGRYEFTGSEDVAVHRKVQVCRSRN